MSNAKIRKIHITMQIFKMLNLTKLITMYQYIYFKIIFLSMNQVSRIQISNTLVGLLLVCGKAFYCCAHAVHGRSSASASEG